MLICLFGILTLFRFPTETGQRWKTVPALAFSSDGKTLAAGMYNGLLTRTSIQWLAVDLCSTVVLLDPQGNEDALVLDQALRPGKWHSLISVAAGRFADTSPQSPMLATGGFKGVVKLWDLVNRRLHSSSQTRPEQVANTIGYVAFSQGGHRLAAAGRHWTFVWDPRGLGKGRRMETRVNARALAVSPDGTQVAVGGHRTLEVELWNTRTLQRQRVLNESTLDQGSTQALAFSPHGDTLAAALSGSVQLWDTRSWTVRATVDERLALDVAFSPDGDKLATGGARGIQFWDRQTGERRPAPLRTGPVESLAFSPDGRMLATGDMHGNVTVWDMESGARLSSTRIAGQWRTHVPAWLPLVLLFAWTMTWFWLIRVRREHERRRVSLASDFGRRRRTGLRDAVVP